MGDREISASQVHIASQLERKIMDDEFAREQSFGPFMGREVGDPEEERDKQQVRKMFRNVLHTFQQVASVPRYGRAGVGDGSYGQTAGVSGVGFREWLEPFLPDKENAVGRFVLRTAMFNKQGSKVTERSLVRRSEDMYRDTPARRVRAQLEALCAEIVMRQDVGRLVAQLEDMHHPVTHAALDDVRLSSEHAIDAIVGALEGHASVEALQFHGNGLGSHGRAGDKEELERIRRLEAAGGAAADDEALRSLHASGSALSIGGVRLQRPLERLTRALARVKPLVSLTLSANGVTDRDVSAIARLSRLHTLNLPNNELEDTGALLLAESLAFFKQLVALDVSRNRIGDKGLVALVNALTDHGRQPLRLQALRVAHNRFSGGGFRALAEGVRESRSLALLSVGGNTLTRADDAHAALARALRKNRSIAVLDASGLLTDAAVGDRLRLDGAVSSEATETRAHAFDITASPLGDRVPAVLGDALKNNQLRSLDVSNNLMTPHGFHELARGLAGASRLATLSLAWNDLRDQGAAQLAKLLRASKAGVTDLDLSYNYMTEEGIVKVLKTMVKGVRQVPLRRLTLAGNYFHGEKVPLLIKLLNSRSLPLEHLDVSHMSCRAMWRVCEAIGGRNRHLRSLNLARNKIRFKKVSAAEEFAELILSSRSLERLDMSFNELGDDGALAFARHLHDNAHLKHLDLSGNGMTKPSAYGIARSLVHNRTLHTLLMRWNYIGHQGASALLDMMSTNPALTTLDAAGYGVPFRLRKEVNAMGAGVFHMVDETDDGHADADALAAGGAGTDAGFDEDIEALPDVAKPSAAAAAADKKDAKKKKKKTKKQDVRVAGASSSSDDDDDGEEEDGDGKGKDGGDGAGSDAENASGNADAARRRQDTAEEEPSGVRQAAPPDLGRGVSGNDDESVTVAPVAVEDLPENLNTAADEALERLRAQAAEARGGDELSVTGGPSAATATERRLHQAGAFADDEEDDDDDDDDDDWRRGGDDDMPRTRAQVVARAVAGDIDRIAEREAVDRRNRQREEQRRAEQAERMEEEQASELRRAETMDKMLGKSSRRLHNSSSTRSLADAAAEGEEESPFPEVY